MGRRSGDDGPYVSEVARRSVGDRPCVSDVILTGGMCALHPKLAVFKVVCFDPWKSWTCRREVPTNSHVVHSLASEQSLSSERNVTVLTELRTHCDSAQSTDVTCRFQRTA